MTAILIILLIAGFAGLVICEHLKTRRIVKVVAAQIWAGKPYLSIKKFLQYEGWTLPEIRYIMAKAEKQAEKDRF